MNKMLFRPPHTVFRCPEIISGDSSWEEQAVLKSRQLGRVGSFKE